MLFASPDIVLHGLLFIRTCIIVEFLTTTPTVLTMPLGRCTFHLTLALGLWLMERDPVKAAAIWTAGFLSSIPFMVHMYICALIMARDSYLVLRTE